jgi:hypothetical protein
MPPEGCHRCHSAPDVVQGTTSPVATRTYFGADQGGRLVEPWSLRPAAEGSLPPPIAVVVRVRERCGLTAGVRARGTTPLLGSWNLARLGQIGPGRASDVA